MSELERDRWTLIVEFDTLREMVEAESYLVPDYPAGEAAAFYTWLREYWDNGIPEELDQWVRLEGETVTATTDVIDTVAAPMRWVIMHTVPKRMELKREASRR